MQRRRFLKTAAGLFVPAACGIVRAQPFQLNDPALLAATRPKASGFSYTAAKLDGSTNYLNRGSDLTGNADGSIGTISCWFKLNGGNATAMDFMCNSGSYFFLQRNDSNLLELDAFDSSPSKILGWSSNASFASSSSWHHLLLSWDLTGTPKWVAYVDDAAEANASPKTAGTINYASGSLFRVGAHANGTNLFFGSLSEFWFSNSTYYDFTVAGNRRLFDDGAGHPVSPPTGAIIYLHNPYTSFGTNSGSGGDFSIVGSALTSDTPP